MNLAFVSDFLPNHHSRAGGADWACWRVGELLRGRGARVTYYTNKPDKKIKNDNVRYVPVKENFMPKALADMVEQVKWLVCQFDPLSFIYFLVEFKKNRPDVLCMQRFRFITMSPMFAAFIYGIPVYFSVYDYWMFCALETLIDEKNSVCRKFHGTWCTNCLPKKLTILQKALLIFRKPVFDFALKRIKHFIVLSRSSRDILRSYGIEEKRISIIPLPFGEEIKAVTMPGQTERNTIAYVGWIQKRKGLDVLIKALKKVKEEVPDVKLYVLGPDVKFEKDYRAQVDSLISSLSLKDNVSWVGPKPNDIVQEYLRKSQVIAVPEQWENMSPVIVGEAMFNYKTVVGSKIGGIPDFVIDRQTGLLFKHNDPDELAQKIIYLLKNPDINNTFAKQARAHAEKIFDNSAIAESYIKLYSTEAA